MSDTSVVMQQSIRALLAAADDVAGKKAVEGDMHSFHCVQDIRGRMFSLLSQVNENVPPQYVSTQLMCMQEDLKAALVVQQPPVWIVPAPTFVPVYAAPPEERATHDKKWKVVEASLLSQENERATTPPAILFTKEEGDVCSTLMAM